MLELDHVFFIVADPAEAAARLEDDGWVLDEGQAHRGQGTRNRRLRWAAQYFELLWVFDVGEARANVLRLDRRATWETTGASPIGLAFRGVLDRREDYWLYDALGPRIHVHRDNERFPERPLVFVLEARAEEMRQRRAGRASAAVAHRHPGDLREVRVGGPSAPSLPPFHGPPVVYDESAHALELVVGDGGLAHEVSHGLVVRR